MSGAHSKVDFVSTYYDIVRRKLEEEFEGDTGFSEEEFMRVVDSLYDEIKLCLKADNFPNMYFRGLGSFSPVAGYLKMYGKRLKAMYANREDRDLYTEWCMRYERFKKDYTGVTARSMRTRRKKATKGMRYNRLEWDREAFEAMSVNKEDKADE